MVMMTGEIEYNDLYYPQKEFITVDKSQSSSTMSIEDEALNQFFPLTAHVILTIFILFVAIIIMNLLFGMAVSDVQVSAENNRVRNEVPRFFILVNCYLIWKSFR